MYNEQYPEENVNEFSSTIFRYKFQERELSFIPFTDVVSKI